MSGTITIALGTESNGQGHETAFAQVAADRFGVPVETFRYVQADTREVKSGAGHGGARSMHMGGAALVKAIDDRIGMVSGLMTTVHSYTNDQVLTDVYHEDLRRARSASQNMIPTKTGAAAAVGLVLPELNGKLDGYAIRVPTINVSIVDLTFVAKKATTVEEVNKAVKEAADGALKGVLEYNTAPLVSSDFNHNPASSIFDASLTKVSEGTLVKVSSWYDNEWGFSNRMLDVTRAFMAAK